MFRRGRGFKGPTLLEFILGLLKPKRDRKAYLKQVAILSSNKKR